MKLEIGKTYLVVNLGAHTYVGRLVEVLNPFEVALEDASWVANTGRLHVFVERGRADGMEIEPVGQVNTRYQSIIWWPHKLFDKSE